MFSENCLIFLLLSLSCVFGLESDDSQSEQCIARELYLKCLTDKSFKNDDLQKCKNEKRICLAEVNSRTTISPIFTGTTVSDCCLNLTSTQLSLEKCVFQNTSCAQEVVDLKSQLADEKFQTSKLREICANLNSAENALATCKSEKISISNTKDSYFQKLESYRVFATNCSNLANTYDLKNITLSKLKSCEREKLSFESIVKEYGLVKTMLQTLEHGDFLKNNDSISIISDFTSRFEKTRNDFTECASTLKNTQGELNGIQGLYSGCLLNQDDCDSSLGSLEMEFDSLNSSYIECSSHNGILEMSKKTCDNDLRDAKVELSICQEDLLFTNESLTTCNLEISNKDLAISSKNGEINFEFMAYFTYFSFLVELDKSSAECFDKVDVVQTKLTKCTSDFNDCLNKKKSVQDKNFGLRSDLTSCLNSGNITILSDLYLSRFNVIAYAQENPIVSCIIFGSFGLNFLGSFSLLCICFLRCYLSKRKMKKELMRSRSALNLAQNAVNGPGSIPLNNIDQNRKLSD